MFLVTLPYLSMRLCSLRLPWRLFLSPLTPEMPICHELDYGSLTKTTNFPFAWLDSIY